MTMSAVFYVRDTAPMVNFYRAVLDLAQSECVDWDFVVLTSTDVTMTLVQIPQEWAREIVLTTPPERREDTPIKLVFDVTSLSVAAQQVRGAGGDFDERSAPREWRDWRHYDVVDPEGNVVQLREKL